MRKSRGTTFYSNISFLFFYMYPIYSVYDSNILKSCSSRKLNYPMPRISPTAPATETSGMFHDLKGFFSRWSKQNKVFRFVVSKITGQYLQITQHTLKMWKCCVITRVWKQWHRSGKCKKYRYSNLHIHNYFFFFFLPVLRFFPLFFGGNHSCLGCLFLTSSLASI